MPKNEDGEFELILGNGQLMSVFFVVVILLGVFFAVGYIVGRNASPAAATELASHRTETEKPKGDAAPRDTPVSKTADTPKETSAAPQETASQQGPATKATPPPEPAPAPAPVKASARVATSGEPQSGRTYLQISAVDRDKAEIMVELLRKKNFPAIAAEIPEKPGVYRVLVGPVSEAEVIKTRTELQNASFPGKEAVKKTF